MPSRAVALQEWRSTGIRGVWLKLPIHLSACIPKAVDKVSYILPSPPRDASSPLLARTRGHDPPGAPNDV